MWSAFCANQSRTVIVSLEIKYPEAPGKMPLTLSNRGWKINININRIIAF